MLVREIEIHFVRWISDFMFQKGVKYEFHQEISSNFSMLCAYYG